MFASVLVGGGRDGVGVRVAVGEGVRLAVGLGESVAVSGILDGLVCWLKNESARMKRMNRLTVSVSRNVKVWCLLPLCCIVPLLMLSPASVAA
jgi:hypothetical protein